MYFDFPIPSDFSVITETALALLFFSKLALNLDNINTADNLGDYLLYLCTLFNLSAIQTLVWVGWLWVFLVHFCVLILSYSLYFLIYFLWFRIIRAKIEPEITMITALLQSYNPSFFNLYTYTKLLYLKYPLSQFVSSVPIATYCLNIIHLCDNYSCSCRT